MILFVTLTLTTFFVAMAHSTLLVGSTRSGKSNAAIFIAIQQIMEGAAVLFVDPQPNSSGIAFYKACQEQSLPVVLEDVDSEMILPCDFATASGDCRTDSIIVSNLCDALAANRGMVNAFSHVQIMQHAKMFILCKAYSGLPFHRLKGAWFSDWNKGLLKRINNPDCWEWLETRPSSRSSLIRESEPARRFVEPLTDGPAVRIRDLGESVTIDILNEGTSLVVNGGRAVSPAELSFLLTYRVMEVIQAAQNGKLTRPVYIVMDESEL